MISRISGVTSTTATTSTSVTPPSEGHPIAVMEAASATNGARSFIEGTAKSCVALQTEPESGPDHRVAGGQITPNLKVLSSQIGAQAVAQPDEQTAPAAVSDIGLLGRTFVGITAHQLPGANPARQVQRDSPPGRQHHPGLHESEGEREGERAFGESKYRAPLITRAKREPAKGVASLSLPPEPGLRIVVGIVAGCEEHRT